MYTNKQVLLIIGGGISAYKVMELIRQMRSHGISVPVILTKAGAHFITPLSLSSISQNRVYTDLFDPTRAHEMEHITLSRKCDLVVVAPATADLMARMANGLANDLASGLLLANTRPVLLAPAMNPEMWNNAATRKNVQFLRESGHSFTGPEKGPMACNESGTGRMSEPEVILDAIVSALEKSTLKNKPLDGRKVLVTAGPTHEPIDPVRYLASRSSGKQGYAIATELAKAGADVKLISGPVQLKPPENSELIRVTTACQMYEAVHREIAGSSRPYDLAICAAAVADWRPLETKIQKLKKQDKVEKAQQDRLQLDLKENPDILASIAHMAQNRPHLVIGFAAETDTIEENAKTKFRRKGCDWLLANDVSLSSTTPGGNHNRIFFVNKNETIWWEKMTKAEVGTKLVHLVDNFFQQNANLFKSER